VWVTYQKVKIKVSQKKSGEKNPREQEKIDAGEKKSGADEGRASNDN